MKKAIINTFLVFALALVCAFAIPATIGTAYAGSINQTTTGGTGTTTITYTVAPTYTVTIPDSLVYTAENNTITVAVEAGALLPYRNQIKVTVASANSFTLLNEDYASATLAYTLEKGENTITVENNTVLTHDASKTTVTEEILTVNVTGSPTYSGDYGDQLTFTVAVYDNVG